MANVTASVRSTDQKMAYVGQVRDLPPDNLAYAQPYGEDRAAGPMEHLLMAPGACTASGLALLIRKTGRAVASISAHLAGEPAWFRIKGITALKQAGSLRDGEWA
jgi:uncharacterized OsmC-like protein